MRIQNTNASDLRPVISNDAVIKKESAFGQWLKSVSNDFTRLKNQNGKDLGQLITNMSLEVSPCATQTFENGIPTELHFIWEGADISEDHLSNILLNAALACDYNINVWTTRPISIYSTLEKMMHSEDNARFRYLARNYSNAITIKDPEQLYDELKTELNSYNKYNDKVTEGAFLASVFHREINGVYKNYAAASDITRLVLLYLKGGCYMDVDTVCNSMADIEENKIRQGFLIGQESDIQVHTAFLASEPRSVPSQTLLNTMIERLMAADAGIRDYKVLKPGEASASRNMSSVAAAQTDSTSADADAKDAIEENKDDMLLWVTKRSDAQKRFEDTLKMTGPDLIVDTLLNRKKGINYKGEFYSSSDKKEEVLSLEGKSKKQKAAIKKATKAKLKAETEAVDILFSSLRTKFNASSGWTNLNKSKKDAQTL